MTTESTHQHGTTRTSIPLQSTITRIDFILDRCTPTRENPIPKFALTPTEIQSLDDARVALNRLARKVQRENQNYTDCPD